MTTPSIGAFNLNTESLLVTSTGTFDYGVIALGGLTIDGCVVNEGAIGLGTTAPESGIRFDSGTTVTGGVENHGLLRGDLFGLNFQMGNVQGSVLNSGNIFIENVTGFGMVLNGQTVGEDIENSGNIDNGINLLNSTVGGDLVNTGLLQKGRWGLRMSQTSIAGAVRNDGDIKHMGGSALRGISIENNSSVDALINTGTIEYSIYIDAATIRSAITNSGLITDGNSNNGYGVRISNGASVRDIFNDASGEINGALFGLVIAHAAVDNNITNRGDIVGEDAAMGTGLQLDDATVGGSLVNEAKGEVNAAVRAVSLVDSSSISGSLDNRGSIAGYDTGIYLSSDSTIAQGINNWGIIAGGKYALLLENAVNVTIQGTEAELVGDVDAGQATMTLVAGSDLMTRNAFRLQDLTVEDGAALTLADMVSSSGMVPDGLTVSGGFSNAGLVVIPVGATAVVDGGFTQSGVLRIGVKSASDYGQLQVSGIADMGSHMKIDVDVSPANTLNIGDGLTDVVTAGTLVGADSFTVTDNSYLFDFEAVKDGNAIDLSVLKGTGPVDPTDPVDPADPTNPTDPTDPSAGGGTVDDAVRGEKNRPARGVARVMDRLIDRFVSDGTTGNGKMDQVIGKLGALGTRKDVSEAASQLLPSHNGGSSQATGGAMQGTRRAIHNRLQDGTGRASGDVMLDDKRFWVKPFGSWADQSDRQGVSGYSAQSYGLVFGADAEIQDGARLGVAFSYNTSLVKGNSGAAPQKAHVDSYQAVFYGAHALNEATEVTFQADAGLHANDNSRQIAFLGQTATADYNSWSGHVGGGVTHRLDLADGTTFTPGIRADYNHIYDPAYRENGAGAVNLNVDSNHTRQFLLSAEGTLEHDLTDRVSVSANVGVSFDVVNERTSITSAFAGEPGAAFTTEGMQTGPWIGTGGFGVAAKLTDSMTLNVNYDLEVREGFTNQSASAKVRWAF
ncbi:autotransporter family protein [Sneathiella chinensis]|nr:autotransporter outer membrane beta-barrel domain-containing protein [Sneathiella chinensis]